MSLVALFVGIVLVGIAVWVAELFPIPAAFKRAVQIVGIVLVVALVLEAFGLWDAFVGIRVPRLR